MTAEQLEAWMKAHALEHYDLAKLLGVTEPAVLHWIAKRRTIPLTTVRLLKLFDKYPELVKEFK